MLDYVERYKAPELFMTRDNKFPVATFEGDIHALGCICFEVSEEYDIEYDYSSGYSL